LDAKFSESTKSSAPEIGMFLADPWFWAFAAMFGWFLGLMVVGSRTWGSSTFFGVVCLAFAEAPRAALPLYFVGQPRFGGGAAFAILGGLIFAGSLTFAAPVFRIRPLTRPNSSEPLRTDGFYALVRHPLMFADAFWPLGWSLMFGSVIGVALTPLWLVVCWLLTFLEEEKLMSEYGDEYERYRRKVPSRIIPGVRC
jgi:protein-S-isoprenylcysteine O-methyltransferase Ste14